MKLIAHGDIYDLPPYAECDLDALVVGITIPNLVQMTVDAITAAFHIPPFRIPPTFHPMNLPAAAGLGGAGSLAPVSGLDTAPGAPNETRNE